MHKANKIKPEIRYPQILWITLWKIWEQQVERAIIKGASLKCAGGNQNVICLLINKL